MYLNYRLYLGGAPTWTAICVITNEHICLSVWMYFICFFVCETNAAFILLMETSEDKCCVVQYLITVAVNVLLDLYSIKLNI